MKVTRERRSALQRQLAAILFADVAGYSRLMDLYEAATHPRMRTLLAEVIEPTITTEAGRIVKHTGDGFLACFASVNNAIQAAILIQREVRRREAAQSAEHQIAFRMGLHSGDIVIEDHDVYGTGVNVAARLQELADPGGLLISGAVREQLGSNLSLPVADLGQVELKNIANPVRVFAVHTAVGGAPAPPRAMPRSRRGIPSIAVLPFTEYGAGPDQSYFGDGLVEDIVAALATFPGFHVISRNSTLKYRGSDPDLQSVASELGVRYVLTGNVRRRNDRLRISAELADVETLQAIGGYQGEDAATELFALQDRLTECVVQTLAPNIRSAELRRIRRKRPENLDTYECFLRGLDLLYRLDHEEFDQARRMFEEAIRLDPDYAPPYAFTAQWHSLRANQGWSPDRKADLAKVNEFASAALLRDPNNVWALALSGHLRALLFRDFETAFDLFDRALRASPNSAFAWSRSSPTYTYVGNTAEARRRAEQALRLSPFEPDIFFTHCALGFAAYTEGDYRNAIAWARRSYAENPVYTANLRFLVASLAAAGEIEEARLIGESLVRLEPSFSVRRFIETYAYQDARLRSRISEHLNLAGLPD
jgi:adenylate cyclase